MTLELLAGAFVFVGLVAVIARFVAPLFSGRAALPRIVEQSVGMWMVRRLRTELGRGPTATSTPVTGLEATPDRLAAAGTRRPSPALNVRPPLAPPAAAEERASLRSGGRVPGRRDPARVGSDGSRTSARRWATPAVFPDAASPLAARRAGRRPARRP